MMCRHRPRRQQKTRAGSQKDQPVLHFDTVSHLRFIKPLEIEPRIHIRGFLFGRCATGAVFSDRRSQVTDAFEVPSALVGSFDFVRLSPYFAQDDNCLKVQRQTGNNSSNGESLKLTGSLS